MAPRVKMERMMILINVGMKKSVLDKAKLVAQKKIENMIFNYPNDALAVVLINSDTTKNKFGAEHVEIFIEFQVPNWDCVRKIINLESKDYHCSNWVEALEASVQYATENIEWMKNVTDTKIILMSDFNEEEDVISQFNAEIIADTLSGHGINLITLADAPLNDRGEKLFTPSELLLKEVSEKIHAQYTTFDNAVSSIRYQVRKVKGVPTYFTLELADIRIPIASYVKVMKAKIITSSWKRTASKEIVEKEVHYLDRTRNTFTKDEIVKGYKYGGSFVPAEKELLQKMTYKSGPKSYRVHSFINRAKIDLDYLQSSGSHVLLPGSKDAKVQFYSLVKALNNTNAVAIARKVSSANCTPKMVALIPCMDVPDEPWCLIEIHLAFKEDRRVIIPRSVRPDLTQLTDEQNKAVDDLIDSLTLPDVDDSYEVDGSKQFLPGCVPDPTAQRIFHIFSSRALDPEKPMEDIKYDFEQVIEMRSKTERATRNLVAISKLFRLHEEQKSKSGFSAGREENKTPATSINKADEMIEDVENDIEVPVLKAEVMDADLDEMAADI